MKGIHLGLTETLTSYQYFPNILMVARLLDPLYFPYTALGNVRPAPKMDQYRGKEQLSKLLRILSYWGSNSWHWEFEFLVKAEAFKGNFCLRVYY